VSGLCGALLRSRPEAEDATQQTFLSAHRALLNGSEPLEPAAWLATIARNECWSRIRTRMRQPLAAEPLDAVSGEPDPLAEAIRRADLAALWQAIEALPRQQRDALLLREFGGLSYGELAAALAVSAPAVESLLFRARRSLRASLRAAYASLAGAPWLETLARAFAGGGAPVAAKVAALGVGAAAVTGGAVVAPDVLERLHHRTPPPAVVRPHVRHVQASPEPQAAPVQAASVVRPVQETAAKPASEERRGGEDGRRETRAPASVHERSGGAEPEGTESRGSSSGESRDGEDAGVTLTVPAVPVATVTVEEGRDGGDGGHDGGGGGD
jgi:RNA polymerase sigma factor (sigma-70 family)